MIDEDLRVGVKGGLAILLLHAVIFTLVWLRW